MNISLILFLIEILGFVLNRKNIILMLISIEILLLAITFLILLSSIRFDDILSQVFAIYVICFAEAESSLTYSAFLALPLLGPIISGFLARKVGKSGAQTLTTFCVMLTAVFSAFTFFEVGLNNLAVFIQLFTWIDSESHIIVWAFNYEFLTVSMLIPVLIVSSLVHLYSQGYLSYDLHINEFYTSKVNSSKCLKSSLAISKVIWLIIPSFVVAVYFSIPCRSLIYDLKLDWVIPFIAGISAVLLMLIFFNLNNKIPKFKSLIFAFIGLASSTLILVIYMFVPCPIVLGKSLS